MGIIVSAIIGIIGIAVSWYIARRYGGSAINKKLLEEKRIEQCMEKYTHTGGGDFLITMIDTYNDLSNEEKASLLDTALLRARGRKAKDNPFRKRDEK